MDNRTLTELAVPGIPGVLGVLFGLWAIYRAGPRRDPAAGRPLRWVAASALLLFGGLFAAAQWYCHSEPTQPGRMGTKDDQKAWEAYHSEIERRRAEVIIPFFLAMPATFTCLGLCVLCVIKMGMEWNKHEEWCERQSKAK